MATAAAPGSPPRHPSPSIAALLSLFLAPFLAMFYLGRVARGFAYLGGVGVAIAAATLLASNGLWVAGIPWVWVVYAINIGGAFDAYRIASRHETGAPVRWYSRWYGLVAVLLAFVVVGAMGRILFVGAYSIPSRAMLPTLVPGDEVFVDTYSFGLGGADPRRGDVVVVTLPEQPVVMIISRVVGMPGDRFAYRDGTVYIDEEAVEQTHAEPYQFDGDDFTRYDERLGEAAHSVLEQPGAPGREGEIVVPDAQYIVLGDNRDNARDSRFVGTIPRELVGGRVVRVWWNTETPSRALSKVR